MFDQVSTLYIFSLARLLFRLTGILAAQLRRSIRVLLNVGAALQKGYEQYK